MSTSKKIKFIKGNTKKYIQKGGGPTKTYIVFVESENGKSPVITSNVLQIIEKSNISNVISKIEKDTIVAESGTVTSNATTQLKQSKILNSTTQLQQPKIVNANINSIVPAIIPAVVSSMSNPTIVQPDNPYEGFFNVVEDPNTKLKSSTQQTDPLPINNRSPTPIARHSSSNTEPSRLAKRVENQKSPKPTPRPLSRTPTRLSRIPSSINS